MESNNENRENRKSIRECCKLPYTRCAQVFIVFWTVTIIINVMIITGDVAIKTQEQEEYLSSFQEGFAVVTDYTEANEIILDIQSKIYTYNMTCSDSHDSNGYVQNYQIGPCGITSLGDYLIGKNLTSWYNSDKVLLHLPNEDDYSFTVSGFILFVSMIFHIIMVVICYYNVGSVCRESDEYCGNDDIKCC